MVSKREIEARGRNESTWTGVDTVPHIRFSDRPPKKPPAYAAGQIAPTSASGHAILLPPSIERILTKHTEKTPPFVQSTLSSGKIPRHHQRDRASRLLAGAPRSADWSPRSPTSAGRNCLADKAVINYLLIRKRLRSSLLNSGECSDVADDAAGSEKLMKYRES